MTKGEVRPQNVTSRGLAALLGSLFFLLGSLAGLPGPSGLAGGQGAAGSPSQVASSAALRTSSTVGERRHSPSVTALDVHRVTPGAPGFDPPFADVPATLLDVPRLAVRQVSDTKTRAAAAGVLIVRQSRAPPAGSLLT